MSAEENKNQKPQERPIPERQPNTNIEKGRTDEGYKRESPTPLSWQPIRDQTDSNPPDGGSGVEDSSD